MSDPRPCKGDAFRPVRYVAGIIPTCFDCAEQSFEAAWGELDKHGTPGYGKCLGPHGEKLIFRAKVKA